MNAYVNAALVVADCYMNQGGQGYGASVVSRRYELGRAKLIESQGARRLVTQLRDELTGKKKQHPRTRIAYCTLDPDLLHLLVTCNTGFDSSFSLTPNFSWVW